MALTINQNTTAIIAAKMLEKADTELTDSLERMATGQKINSAADDASGMTIADSLKVSPWRKARISRTPTTIYP